MKSKNCLQLLLVSLVLMVISSCQEATTVIEEIDFKTDYTFSSDIETKLATDTVPWKYQISTAAYAAKGDYKNALIQWDLAMRGRNQSFTKKQIDSIHLRYSKVPAREYIIKEAATHQVIIINEAHHNSFHRVFTKSLLKELYDIGYRNLGLEALSSGKLEDSLLNERHYPIQETGHYIKDPQFGDVVRTALEIGYRVFPYEQTTNVNGKPREIEQAKHIQKVMEAHPNEKFLLHCGFDHALEGEHKSWEKAMAGRLTEYTGINPLTINQTAYSERSNPELNHPLLKALDIKESSVVLDTDENPLRYERRDSWTDIAVFHPNTTYVDGRPDWLFKNGNQNISVSLAGIEITYPVMVLAFKKGEDIDVGVPLDITGVKSKTDSCHLGLKNGTYTIVVTNGEKSFKFEQKVQ